MITKSRQLFEFLRASSAVICTQAIVKVECVSDAEDSRAQAIVTGFDSGMEYALAKNFPAHAGLDF